MISAIVMASGLSRRMGENKLKLLIDGKEMYKYTVDLVAEMDFRPKILVSNDKDILEYGKEKGFEVFDNPNAHIGKSESIRIGVENSPEKLEGYMFFVCDQPFVSKETVEKITETFQKDPTKITVPYYDGKRGAPMLFPANTKEGLLALKGDEGGVLLLKDHPVEKVVIEEGLEHTDIDTPKDYEKINDVL
ncbi:MAG: nucleotidyltransferase family protein [Tissierellia bacterium]|nr:nucleotidyltransferase family protein [Tissierellia bacterium]